ncbi:MAG TPA: DUF370 domain-containing protein [Candidatus Latescibacteria bacterium]|nr:DUF370 domain-containing protein [Candidatus Latescibacterota bacterium]
MPFINVGFGNLVAVHRIVAIVSPNSSPIRRLKAIAERDGKLIDASQGRKTRSVIVLDSDHVVLSAIGPETLLQRLEGKEDV